MNIGEKITFNQLFDKVDFIEVPIIQRDYAQGREEQSEVRHLFLDSLFSALMIDRTNGDKHDLCCQQRRKTFGRFHQAA